MTLFERTCFYSGILLVFVLVLMIFFSKNGVIDYNKLKKKEAVVASQSVQVEKENQKIEKEIKSLKHDINYIKHLAKHEHEMAEPGELIFKDKNKDKNKDKGNKP